MEAERSASLRELETRLNYRFQEIEWLDRAVRAIMAVQAGREARLAAADDVIDNDGDLEALRAQVARLHRRYLDAARA